LPRMPEELVISDGRGVHLPQRSESQHKDLKPEAAGVLGLFQMPPTDFSVRGKEYILLWKKPWILVKYDASNQAFFRRTGRLRRMAVKSVKRTGNERARREIISDYASGKWR
jgi:hypothetical protein